MPELRGQPGEDKLRLAIVASRWNELIVNELVRGALDELALAGIAESDVVSISVPGAWEIPLAVQLVVTPEARVPGGPVDAVIALGCILQGETSHAAQLATEVGRALMDVQLRHSVPVSWGVLTPDSPEQALDRSGLKHGHKGREAARAALEMARLRRQLVP